MSRYLVYCECYKDGKIVINSNQIVDYDFANDKNELQYFIKLLSQNISKIKGHNPFDNIIIKFMVEL